MQKITNQQIKDLIASMEKRGVKVGLKDISYVYLSQLYDDRTSAYKVLFGKESMENFSVYDASEKVAQLHTLMQEMDISPEKEEMSFDELKKGMVEDMQSLIALRDSGDLEAKDMAAVVARIADIRVKLTSKFGTTEKATEQRVVVNQKYNDVCPYCRHEIAIKRG